MVPQFCDHQELSTTLMYYADRGGAGKPNVPEIRILVAQANDLIRRGMCALLETQPNWKVRSARNSDDTLKVAVSFHPHVALVDMHLRGETDGIETSRRLRKAHPTLEIVLIGTDEREELIRAALKAGVRAYLTTQTAARDLLQATANLAVHKPFLTGAVTEFLLNQYLQSGHNEGHSDLSPRERQVLQLLAEGKSNKEIAAVFKVSPKTVATHRARIMRKLKIRSLAELIHYAVRHQLIRA